MRLLIDENLPNIVLTDLISNGHDTIRITGNLLGIKDEQVLEEAQFERRTLITLDKGFGKLTVFKNLPAVCGVILVRYGGSPKELSNFIVETLNSGTNFVGHITIAKKGSGLRQRPLATEVLTDL